LAEERGVTVPAGVKVAELRELLEDS